MIAQYYINNEKQELINSIDREKNRVQALQKIEIVHKKNGEPFKNLSQNFKNAHLTGGSFGMDYNLTYYYSSKNDGYQVSYVSIYLYTDSLDKNDPRYDPKPNGIIRKMCIMNFDEIKITLEKNITDCLKYLAELETSLANFDIVVNKYLDKYDLLLKELQQELADTKQLQYTIRHLFKEF